MKIKTILLTLTIALSSMVGQAQTKTPDKVFENLSNRKDIQQVHVSKSLLGMISEMNTGGADIAHLADKLKQIDVYASESDEAMIFMKGQADFFAKDKSYETFMTLKEKTQTVIFYGMKSGEKFKDLVMVVSESDKCVIFRMVGEFTAKDIQQVVKKKE